MTRITVPAAVLAASAIGAHAQQQQIPQMPRPSAASASEPAPASPATAAAPAIRGDVDPNEYRVGPGDKLRIEVYKEAQLSQSVQVRPDGKITLPFIGDLDAAGQPPMALRDSIAQALKTYVTNPTVTVMVVEVAVPIAYVVGEVNHPGSVTLQGGPITVLQAIALAGGLKDFADTKNIRILRRTAGGVEPLAFNYKDALRGKTPVMLQQGDTVVVPD